MKNNSKSAVWDVIVVGAGPVGLLLAGDLAAAGVRVAVLDSGGPRQAEAWRANGVVGRAAVELRRRGLLRGTGFRAVRAPRFRFGTFLLELGLLRSPLHILPVPQHRLELLLGQRAMRLGANIVRGQRVTGIEQDDVSVIVRAVSEQGNTRWQARYLAGCDGAHSLVRKDLGIAFPGQASPCVTRMARVTIPADAARRDARHLAIHGAIRLPLFQPFLTEHGSVTIAPMDTLDQSQPSDNYVISIHEPTNYANPAEQLSEGELRSSVQRVLEFDLPFTTVHASRSIVLQSRQAETYRSGRALIAGDAAHVYNAGGSALNIGLLDAISLANALITAITTDTDQFDDYEGQQYSLGRRALASTRVQHLLETPGNQQNALREVFTELLRSRSAARRIANLIES